MTLTTRAKKIKLEDEEIISRINDLSRRLKNLEAFNEINGFINQPDSLSRSVRLQYSLISTIVDGICKKKITLFMPLILLQFNFFGFWGFLEMQRQDVNLELQDQRSSTLC